MDELQEHELKTRMKRKNEEQESRSAVHIDLKQDAEGRAVYAALHCKRSLNKGMLSAANKNQADPVLVSMLSSKR